VRFDFHVTIHHIAIVVCMIVPNNVVDRFAECFANCVHDLPAAVLAIKKSSETMVTEVLKCPSFLNDEDFGFLESAEFDDLIKCAENKKSADASLSASSPEPPGIEIEWRKQCTQERIPGSRKRRCIGPEAFYRTLDTHGLESISKNWRWQRLRSEIRGLNFAANISGKAVGDASNSIHRSFFKQSEAIECCRIFNNSMKTRGEKDSCFSVARLWSYEGFCTGQRMFVAADFETFARKYW
jgi:hypothetical protein